MITLSGNAYVDLSLFIITLSLFIIVVVIIGGCLIIEVNTFHRKRQAKEDYRMLFNTSWSKKP